MPLLEEVRPFLRSHWGSPVTPEMVLVEHFERVVFRCRHPSYGDVTVKADIDAGRFTNEVRAMGRAGAAGVPVPEVLEAYSEAEPAVLVMRWVDGTPLVADSPDAQWAAIGRVLRRLHDLASPDGIAPHWPDKWAVARAQLDLPVMRQGLTRYEREGLAGVIDTAPAPCRPCAYCTPTAPRSTG